MLSHLDLFSGIGGFALAARMVGGIQTKQFVEIDPYCRERLKLHWEGVSVHDDIRTFTARNGDYDLITGGFPCQDLSLANQDGKGLAGERSGLWYEMLRVVKECQPGYVVIENVFPSVGREWDVAVRDELAAVGYTVAGLRVRAADVGAVHLRKRLFLTAYANRFRFDPLQALSCVSRQISHSESTTWWQDSGELRRGHSGRVFLLPRSWSGRVDDGLPSRVDRMRLHALGNAVVPQVAAVVLRRVLELDSLRGKEKC